MSQTKKTNLSKVFAQLGSVTMISRVLGFIRDMIVARYFGAGAAMDAFVVAFRLPNLLRRIFAEGAFSQAFTPILAEHQKNRTHEETQAFVQHVAGMLSFALCVITALGVLAAPWVIWLTAHGYVNDGTERFDLAVDLLRLVFPYILLISLSSFVGSILNAYNKFSIPAFTPTLLNISFIVFSVFFLPYFDPPVMALGWAVLVGGVAQLAFQLPWLFRLGFLKKPKLSFANQAVNRVVKQMLPAIFGASAQQLSLLLNTVYASFLVSGSVTWIYYADRLMELPSGVIGAALGSILLPSLSKQTALNNQRAFSDLLDWGLRLCLLLILPAAVGFFVLAFPLIATLFMYGKFDVHDSQMTQYALMAYALGLPAIMMTKIFAPGFYAMKDVKTPVRITVISLLVTQILNVLMVFVLQWQHVGLTLSMSLGSCVNAALLYLRLRRRGVYQPKSGWARYIKQLTCALVVMAFGLLLVQWLLNIQWQNADALLRSVQLGILIVMAMVLYFSTLYLMGLRFHHFRQHSE